MVWIVGILAFIVGLLIGWWIADRMCKRRFAEAEASWNTKLAAASTADAKPAAFAAPAPTPEAAADPDDLTKIEGIGPKIAELLTADGITTYAGLAAASRDRLAGVLEGGGPRYQMHDPTSWPAQADLAAAGRWDDLKELQDNLSGGRAE